MKKIIFGLSGILVAAFVIVLVANAQNSTQEVKKASAQTVVDCGKCPAAVGCAGMAEAKKTEAKTCDPAKCKEMGCDPAKCKEGKCDPAKCTANCAGSKEGMVKCDPAKCSGMAKK